MFQPIKISLASPLMHGEKEISDIVFGREMEAGDLRGISVSDITHDNILEVTSRITGVPPSVLRKLKIQDYKEVSDVVGGFLGDSPSTGGKA